MQGIPVVGLATTELVTVIRNGYNGYIHTNIRYLADCMQQLLSDPRHAAELGAAGHATARERFCIKRFTNEWEHLLSSLVQQKPVATAISI